MNKVLVIMLAVIAVLLTSSPAQAEPVKKRANEAAICLMQFTEVGTATQRTQTVAIIMKMSRKCSSWFYGDEEQRKKTLEKAGPEEFLAKMGVSLIRTYGVTFTQLVQSKACRNDFVCSMLSTST